uniref:Calmodulin n=1 Tax=Parastrongyloides trichosuri TaxID=131310 RepID=A0A0N4ZZ90_PARTI
MLIRDIENQPDLPKYKVFPKIPSGFITIPAKFSPVPSNNDGGNGRDPEIPRHPAATIPFNNIPQQMIQHQQFPSSGIQHTLQWNRPNEFYTPYYNPIHGIQQNPTLNMFSTFPTDYHFPQGNYNNNDDNKKNYYRSFPDILTTSIKRQYIESFNEPSYDKVNEAQHSPITYSSLTLYNNKLQEKRNISSFYVYFSSENTINGIKNIPTTDIVGKKEIINNNDSPHKIISSPKKMPSTHSFDKSIDTNLDGVLDYNEVEYAAFVHHGLSGTVVQDIFNAVDSDRNRVLDFKEFNDMKPLIIEKALNAASRYMVNVDVDKNGKLSLEEAKKYVLKEYGIGYRDVERIWLLVVSSPNIELDVNSFAIFRRRLRGMSIRLARQVMKFYDHNDDYSLEPIEAKKVAYEQEGITDDEVEEMIASCDDDKNGELNPAEFADFLRLVRAKAVDTAKRAMKVLDSDKSETISMVEAKKIAFEHYGYDEWQLAPIFGQADENEDNELDIIEFAGFRSVIRSKSIKTAGLIIRQWDKNLNGVIDLNEAEDKTREEDDLDAKDCYSLFVVADQNKDEVLNKVEFADFLRMVRSSSIKIITENMSKFDKNGDEKVTVDEVAILVHAKYGFAFKDIKKIFERVDSDFNEELSPGEIVDLRHQTRLLADEKGIKPKVVVKHIENKTIKLSPKVIEEEKETNIPTPDVMPIENEEDMDFEETTTQQVTTTTIKKNKKRRRKIKITTTTTTTEAPGRLKM